MAFLAADKYGMKIDQIADDGAITPMVQADFWHVDTAPPEFLRMATK
jgi:hypothetical protein